MGIDEGVDTGLAIDRSYDDDNSPANKGFAAATECSLFMCRLSINPFERLFCKAFWRSGALEQPPLSVSESLSKLANVWLPLMCCRLLLREVF